MTEKRYMIEEIDNMFRVLKDNEPLTTKFENYDKQDVTNLIAELNELAEENKEIKIQYDNLKAQRDEFYRGARENANRVGQLERENKELKKENQYIKNTIQTMLNNERTHIGQSVLKQLIQNIGDINE